MSKTRILRSSTNTAAATTVSRVLGLVRTILEAKYIGGGTVMTAWELAFMVPNLFRRLLGEGALGSALVPLVAYTLQKHGKEQAKKDLACIFAALSAVLAVICIIIGIASMVISELVETERVKLAFQVLPVVAPYAFFICIIGAMSSVLNSMKVFFLPALAATFLNLAMIACLIWIVPMLSANPRSMLESLGLSVVISGILELLFILVVLYRVGMMPSFSFAAMKNLPVLAELWKMTLPAMLGASALQISLVVDNSIACYINEYAVPSLKYSDRIIYLPIGIFAVSFGSVALASLSHSAAAGKIEEMISSMIFSIRHLLFICIPITFFIFFFSGPLIRFLFFRGCFDERALQETSYAMMCYSVGIPSFAAVKISVAGFYSRKDMKTPLKVSLLCIISNVILNLILMWPLKQGGIAIATVITSVMNNVILLYILNRQLRGIPFEKLLNTLATSAFASGAGVLAAKLVYHYSDFQLHYWHFPKNTIPFVSAGFAFVIIYFVAAFLFKCPEMKEISDILIKRRKSKAS